MDAPLRGKYTNAKIFVRVFPDETMKWKFVQIEDDNKTIRCRCLQDFGKGRDKSLVNYWTFETDGVFYNCNQKKVYDNIMPGVVESVLRGTNAIVVAYGQTGTGKSLTSLGLYNSQQDCGIAPRTIVELFSHISSRNQVKIFMTCLEMRNSRCIDLLDPDLRQMDQNNLGAVTQKRVRNEADALDALYRAEGRRQFVDKCFYESHRASFVVTLEVIGMSTKKTKGKLHIVDLASVDIYGTISCSYKELFDVSNGNLTKSQLEQFLLILCEDIPSHVLVKYRLNILLFYLKDSFNAHSILRFIAHINIDFNNLSLTLSVLRFGQIIKSLPPKILTENAVESEEVIIEKLKQEIEKFKAEKIMQSMMMNTDLKTTELTRERLLHMQNLAKEYLKDQAKEITILTVADVTTFLKVFKDMYNCLEMARKEEQGAIYEKAYADALEKISVKGSTKKQSLKQRNATASKTSAHSDTKSAGKQVAEEKMKQHTTSSQTLKHTKRSVPSAQSSLRTIRSTPSKGSRKKSSNQSTETIREPVIPEGPLSYDQAFSAFKNNAEYNYKGLLEDIYLFGMEADTANQEYIKEVRKLREKNELLKKRQYELLQARMQKQIIDDSDLNDLEMLCVEKVGEVEIAVVEQQESVLRAQAELKMAMENHQCCKKRMNEEFDKFCLEKFKTLIPEILEELEERVIEKEEQILKAETEVEVSAPQLASEKYNFLMKHDELQQIMFMEKKRIQAKKRQNRKWV